MDQGITLSAQISNIRTTPDGGWAITVVCGQDDVKKVAILSNYRGSTIEVAFVPHPNSDPLDQIGRL
jgi:hypothetical protein